ncbi:MAG: glycoside-pentoside-hexuronide (GPH):cation symporter [Oscillospiraceae bacterium]|nr:glycoside-pentoside-hexuronide (GPH):cation symporter [Oscillospiraceae bacterium]
MQSESKALNSERIPMRQQLAYALSELASCPLYTIVFTFLTFFYTDVLGMNAGTVGIVILASKVFDGISDLWAGNLIDHTHTRNGSARPWILRAAIPLALSYVLLFTVPDMGNVGKILYIFVTYNFAMTVAFTINNCAINALPVYMSNDTTSRSSAYAVRTIFAGVVQMAVSMVFLNLVENFGGGQAGWIKVSGLLAAISLLFSLVVYFGTRERTVRANEEKVENVPFKTAIGSVLQNRYWFMVLAMILIIALHQVATLTVGVYYAKYILLDEKLAGNLVLYHHLGGAVGMLAMPFILRTGISKRSAVFAAGLCMVAGSLISAFRGDGVFLIASLALRGMGFGVTNSLYYGMLADSVDYGEWKTGIRATAVTTSAASVGNKLGSGLGSALIGLALSAAGYDGLQAVQTASAVSCIRIVFVVLPLVLYVLLLVLMYFYRLDAQLPRIREELDRKNNA